MLDCRIINDEKISEFRSKLVCAEKRAQTIEKYMRDIKKFQIFAEGKILTKQLLVSYKEWLEKSGRYKVTSINSYLAAVNSYCEAMGWNELHIKMIKVQRDAFIPEEKEITQREYERLVNAALKRGDERLALIIETLASTGIRISELQYITVEILKSGMADIYNKGKARRILLPTKLQEILKAFAKKNNIKKGVIFRTKSNKPIHRSNVWKMMKGICKEARVNQRKVFPHNMRHLFARIFYSMKKDIVKLADVLGHSSMETTRIYIKSTGKEHKRQLDKMKLVIGNLERKKLELMDSRYQKLGNKEVGILT